MLAPRVVEERFVTARHLSRYTARSAIADALDYGTPMPSLRFRGLFFVEFTFSERFLQRFDAVKWFSSVHACFREPRRELRRPKHVDELRELVAHAHTAQ